MSRSNEPLPGTKDWAYESPEGEVFVKHTLELSLSAAYRNLPWRSEKVLKVFGGTAHDQEG